ncbi:hypothetical protein MHYP_G00129850 [Metynnis hypsauchen]
MKTLNAAAVTRLFIILILTVHMAPGVRSGNSGSKVIMADYPNSIDDEFEGCKDEMFNLVKQLLNTELTSNENFKAAWNKFRHGRFFGKKLDSTLTRKDLGIIAIQAYTGSPIYRELNDKMREGRGTYLTGFGLISLHFLITDGIQTRNADQYPQSGCRTTYRRTDITIEITGPSVRFGSFASSSFFSTLTHFGTETCFIITTCYGADISAISKFAEGEGEVLIPPYEVFKSERVTAKPPELSDCNRVYKLSSKRDDSKHKKSKMKCDYVNKDKMG